MEIPVDTYLRKHGVNNSSMNGVTKLIVTHFNDYFKNIEKDSDRGGVGNKDFMFSVLGYLYSSENSLSREQLLEKFDFDINNSDFWFSSDKPNFSIPLKWLMGRDLITEYLSITDLGKIVAKELVLFPQTEYRGNHNTADSKEILESLGGIVKFDYFKRFGSDFTAEQHSSYSNSSDTYLKDLNEEFSKLAKSKFGEMVGITPSFEILTEFNVNFELPREINLKLPLNNVSAAFAENFTSAAGYPINSSESYQIVNVKKTDKGEYFIGIGSPLVEAYKNLPSIKTIREYRDISKKIDVWFDSIKEKYGKKDEK